MDRFSDRMVVFNDPFGLPKSVDLYATDTQPAVHYRVAASTNILGWEFALEFHLAQFRPAPLRENRHIFVGTNGWELQFTARGRVTAIGPGVKPRIPPAVLRAAER